MKKEILGVEWRASIVCIIAVNYPEDGYWQAYIGVKPSGAFSMPFDAEVTKHWTINYGDKLSTDEAMVFFPHLDRSKYKLEVLKKEEEEAFDWDENQQFQD